jgi:hypothetical protein
MLDELAHAGPEHLDPAFVAGYERRQGYPDPAEDLDVFAANGLDATSTVVDLGAGSDGSRPWTSHRRCCSGCAIGPPRPR